MHATLNPMDLTPSGLFPHNKKAETDLKCLVIAEVMEELYSRLDNASSETQTSLQQQAQRRYENLSLRDKLSQAEAEHAISLLTTAGVTESLARSYYLFRLEQPTHNNQICSFIIDDLSSNHSLASAAEPRAPS